MIPRYQCYIDKLLTAVVDAIASSSRKFVATARNKLALFRPVHPRLTFFLRPATLVHFEFMQRAFIEPPVIAVRVLEVDRRETLRVAFLCG